MHTRTSMYEAFTFNNAFTVEFAFTLNGNNEKVLDYSTFSYGSWSVSKNGNDPIVTEGPCHPETGCPPEELHSDVYGQMALVDYAFGQMISANFLQALAAAGEEIQSNGWIWCIIAIVAVVVSLVGFVGSCAATPFTGVAAFLCAASYVGMIASAVGAGRECSGN